MAQMIELVSGSKKRSPRSKKTSDDNYICDSDKDFLGMHGPGDFSNLSCNNFENAAKMSRLDNKVRNKK